ncbi:MAG TPA: DUF2891 family protein [Candidatus Baltobacteraceae bacterium]|nr:DUF2891 family protein [Candidatus Baltobacteraceae bacterium]
MMRDELAPRILPVVLSNVTTQYPYHDSHVSTIDDKPRDPAIAHPSFGNSYDWHSSVHSHWTAVQLIEHFNAHPAESGTALERLTRAVVDHLSAEKIATETQYLREHRTYERPYGWAWTMMLAASVHGARDEAIRGCRDGLDGMADWIAESAITWMTVLPEPVRHGVHSNTAFALGLMHDAARALDLETLRQTIEARARDWFANDRDWPERWERSGHDFVSPGLTEGDLMRRVLPAREFATWWNAFLPRLSTGARILTPVEVPDVADGQIVHLHGLNLSRAGALARIAVVLDDADLFFQARTLYDAGVDRAIDGDYMATHWLATFAWDAAASIERAGASMR